METELEKQISGMTDSYKNNIMQIAVFSLDNKSSTKYGINVNKIKSFVNLSEYKINRNIGGSNNIVKGYAIVRNETFPVVDLLEWISGVSVDNTDYYNKLILTEFNGNILSFPVNKIYRIFSKTSEELEEAEIMDKVTYITKIELKNDEQIQIDNKVNSLLKQIQSLEKRNQKKNSTLINNKIETKKEELKLLSKNKKDEENIEELCFILDVEKLISELIDKDYNIETVVNEFKNKIKTKKPILIAEDSVVAQNILKKTFDKLEIPYELYKNGQLLINRLETNKDFSLIITDIEMPVLDGFSVIKWVRNKIPDAKIIVNTSMSNEGVKSKCESLNVNGFIEKSNPLEIVRQIEKILKDN